MKIKALVLFVLFSGILLITTVGCAVLPTSSTSSSASSSAQSSQEAVVTPTFDPPGGTYISNQSVNVSCATPDTKIYYTLDGSTPTTSGTLFTTNLVIDKPTTLKVIAIKSNMANSQVATAIYTLLTWTESSTDITITGALGNPSSIVIPSTINGKPVTSIGDYAFTNCTGLTNFTLPNSLTSIGNHAFYYCTGLINVTFSTNLTYIGYLAFYHCNILTNVTLPNSLTSIENWAFDFCSSITNFSVDPANTNFMDINGVLFNKDGSELIQYPIGRNQPSYTIPDSVTSIGTHAFHHCDGLRSITLPDSLTSIGFGAFCICHGLTNVTVQATNPPSLEDYAFNHNATGRKIYVPSGSLSNYQAQWSDYSNDIVSY